MNGRKLLLNGNLVILYEIKGISDPFLVMGPVYIHLDFENYKGVYIGDCYDKNLKFTKMVPSR
jgi:hypothetical protein